MPPRFLVSLVALVALPLLAGLVPARQDGPRSPNVLFLLADDQQPDAVGALGNREVSTPHLDRLVSEGFRFDDAYCMGSMSGAVCAPSRAMLLSGRSLWSLEGNVFDLRSEVALLPEVFRAAGYATFATGKWHNGRTWFQRAFADGAELFFGGMGSHTELAVSDYDPAGAYPAATRRPLAAFSSEAFADAAIRFLEEQDGARPFFLYVSFTAPHDPRTPPASWRALYDPAELTLPASFLPRHPFDNGELEIRDEQLAPWPRTPDVLRQQLADYYGMISHLDAQVGRLLAVLDERGLAEDTLVVYTSDHGLAMGRHGLLGKQNLYEHSARAPLLLRGPGIPAGGESDALVYLFDLFPTLCDLAQLPVPTSVEGKSLAGILRGEEHRVRASVLTAYRDVQRAWRTERFKVIEYPRVGRVQLFDLATDPDELHDLAAAPDRADLLGVLRAGLREAQARFGDPHPLD